MVAVQSTAIKHHPRKPRSIRTESMINQAMNSFGVWAYMNTKPILNSAGLDSSPVAPDARFHEGQHGHEKECIAPVDPEDLLL